MGGGGAGGGGAGGGGAGGGGAGGGGGGLVVVVHGCTSTNELLLALPTKLLLLSIDNNAPPNVTVFAPHVTWN